MKCPACGNEIADDARRCPHCGKCISKNAPEFNAGETAAEPAAEPAAAESVSGSEERFCPCCQALLKPGAAFCGNCGASMDGQGGNPYAGNPCNGNVKSGGSGRGYDSVMAISLMNEMNTMMYWIIGYVVVTVLSQLFFPLAIGVLAAFVYIMMKTPSLADRCGKLLDDDSDLSARIAKVRPRVKMLWILFAAQVALFVVVFAGTFIGMVAFNSKSNDISAALLVWGGFFVLLAAAVIADLVYKALLLIDFFKVKDAVARAARGF